MRKLYLGIEYWYKYYALGLCQEGGRFYMNADFLEIINHGHDC